MIESVSTTIVTALSKMFAFLWQTFLGNLWRILTVCAIVFAAGISGSWLGQQMHDPLPIWWGWFGAALAGVAVFGGVNLVLQGERIGWLIIAVGAIADIALSAAYFGESHNVILAIILGAYPTGIAVLGGVVEATDAKRKTKQQADNQREQWEREQAELDRQAQRDQEARRHEAADKRKLEQDRLRANVKVEELRIKALAGAEVHGLPAPSAESSWNSAVPAGNSANVHELSAEDARELSAIRAAVAGNVFTSAEAMAHSSFAKTKFYQLMNTATDAGHLKKVAHGQWEFVG